MTPGARLQAVNDLLRAIHSGTAPADRAIAAFFRAHRYVGAKDRRSVMEMTYAILRSRAKLQWWIKRSRAALQDEMRGYLIVHLALAEGWSKDRIAGSFDGGQYRPMRLDAAEERLLGALEGQVLEHDDQPLCVRLEYPSWIEEGLKARFGEDFNKEMIATLLPAPIDLRVNSLKSNREQAQLALQTEGIEAKLTPLSPLGLRLDARLSLPALDIFQKGEIEVQDEGSQLVALLVGAKPGERVVDFCAGAGGKTLALAACMENKGRIVACDVLEGRIDRASVRFARAGIHNVERRALKSEADSWVKRHKGAFDRVLIDAPCSGTGTWRRNPDARWRLKAQDIVELVALQRRIIESAARLVRPGGRLVYATCSLLPEENESQADWFLNHVPGFTLAPAQKAWKEAFGTDFAEAGDFLNLTPARHGTDGFFAAIFEKAKP